MPDSAVRGSRRFHTREAAFGTDKLDPGCNGVRGDLSLSGGQDRVFEVVDWTVSFWPLREETQGLKPGLLQMRNLAPRPAWFDLADRDVEASSFTPPSGPEGGRGCAQRSSR